MGLQDKEPGLVGPYHLPDGNDVVHEAYRRGGRCGHPENRVRAWRDSEPRK